MSALVCSCCGEPAANFAQPGDTLGVCDGATAVTQAEYDAMVECDCCGKHYPPDEVAHIPAERSGAAQCDTTACDECRGFAS